MEIYIGFLFVLLAVATLYASVGHGVASGYLAVMALMSLPLSTTKPTALSLNVVVSLIAWIGYARAGYFKAQLLWPFLAVSVPMAWIGGAVSLDGPVFRLLLGLALLFAAWRLVARPSQQDNPRHSPPSWLVVALVGAVLGLVSGWVGVGGGIFLTPILILTGWANPKEAAAVSAPFIFFNSLAGLAGWAGAQNPAAFSTSLVFAALSAVLLGGCLRTWLGSSRWPVARLRPALPVVPAFAAMKSFGTAL